MALNLRLTNIPPVTKATLVASFLLSLLQLAFRYRLYSQPNVTSSDSVTDQDLSVPFLTLIPSTSYLFPWTLLTASFVHGNLISVWSRDLRWVLTRTDGGVVDGVVVCGAIS
jgi:membrane associated rhomboid family serine protease